MKHITVGTDIEIFGYEQNSGDLTPFTGKLGADKKNPKQIDDWKHLSVQEDGIACEITFDPSTPKNFYTDAQTAYQKVRYWIRSQLHMDFLNYSEIDTTGHQIPRKANQLGCDPDFDAYVQPVQERPKLHIEDFGGYRFASGHIHLGTKGFGCADEVPPFIQAQFADLFIGAPLRLTACARDQLRPKFYGLPGLYRPKPYGIEYRTPSNQWIFRSDADSFHDMLTSYENLFKQDLAALKTFYKNVDWDLVRTIINQGSTKELQGRWIDHVQELGIAA